jgi:hypothetical protein
MRINTLVAATLIACVLTPLYADIAAAAEEAGSQSRAMAPQIKLVDEYNSWFFGEAFDGNVDKLKAGLPQYITDRTVLHEAASLPWGGTMVGYEGWVRLTHIAGPIFGKISSLLDVSGPKYYRRGNVVIREITMTIKPSPAAPQPFVMGLIEKYTVTDGRISQIDEFYADTAGLVERLTALGAIARK